MEVGINMDEQHRERANEEARKKYCWYKEHGICTKCGHEPAIENSVLCVECSYKQVIGKRKWQSGLTRDQKDKLNKQHKARKDALKAEGRCPTCGKEITDKRYKMCLECRLYHRSWKRENIERKRWKECGFCRYCGSKDVAQGKTLCQSCINKHRDTWMKNMDKANLAVRDKSYWRRLNNADWEKIGRKAYQKQGAG